MNAKLACQCGNPIGIKKCCQVKVNSKPWSGIAKKVMVQQACGLLKQAVVEGNSTLSNKIASAILSKVPSQPNAHYLLGLLAFKQGQLNVARQYVQAALNQGLQDASAFYNFANILAQQNDFFIAITYLKRAMKIKPDFEVALKLGWQLAIKIQDYSEALLFAQKLHQIFGENSNYIELLAETYHLKLDDSNALNVIDKGLESLPNDKALLLLKATIFEMQNRIQDACLLVEQISNDDSDVVLQTLKAKLLFRQDDLDCAQTILVKLLSTSACNLVQKQNIYSILIKVNQSQGDYQAAWQYAEKMNEVRRQSETFKGTLQNIEQSFASVTANLDVMAHRNSTPLKSESTNTEDSRWLFIIGFPRVGSTLLEKHLFQQYDCDDMGESDAIPAVEQAIYSKTGKAWWDLSSADWAQHNNTLGLQSAKNVYQTQGWASGRALIDKNLLNSSRLPLLSKLLPQAPIIKLVRHPMDVLVSCFTNNFGSNDAWHNSLELIARYMLILDEHWFSVVNRLQNPIHILRYEELVTRNDIIDQSLTQFLQLNWLAPLRPLDEDKPQFITRTASYAQVSKDINSDRVHTYLHYLECVPPSIIELIVPMAERWGYKIKH